MKVRFEHFISREMVKDNQEWLFVFGDNLEQTGFGGQAKEMRGEPNSHGIPTKRKPTNQPDAFFKDRPDEIIAVLDAMSSLLRRATSGQYKGIIWPYAGIGTGLAQLDTKSPGILDIIVTFEQTLDDKFYL